MLAVNNQHQHRLKEHTIFFMGGIHFPILATPLNPQLAFVTSPNYE